MTKEEALELLSAAPCDPMPSAINAGITQIQSVEIVRKAVIATPNGKIEEWLAKRVRQVNRPIYR